jgi:type II secretion system protein H
MDHRTHGFSLVELMIVVAIAAIVLAFAIPTLTDSTARRRLDGVAAELATDLQNAKTQAASLNTNVSLVTTSSGYTVTGAAQLKAVTLDTSTALTNGVTVTFEPHRAFPVAASSINLTSPQTTASLRVTVDAVGRVMTCSPSGNFQGYPSC